MKRQNARSELDVAGKMGYAHTNDVCVCVEIVYVLVH